MKMTDFFTKEDAAREWYVVDAQDQVLGRLATRVASVLRGKHKAAFTPNADIGDFVIVINADKVKLTGRKMTDKSYYRHTGYIGGLKETTPGRVLGAKHPGRVVEGAVRGMLPKTRLGGRLFTELEVYARPEQPHQAHAPPPVA